jgi:HTH-like domain
VNCYPFIEAERAGRRNVARACALLKVSRAAFYSYLSGPCRREQQDAELTEQIKAVHAQSRGRYGAPRVHAELRRRGRHHSRKRVARLMRGAGIGAGRPGGGARPPSRRRSKMAEADLWWAFVTGCRRRPSGVGGSCLCPLPRS